MTAPRPPVRNALSVDVEEWFQVSAFSGAIPRSRWDALERRAGLGTRRLLDLFDRRGVRATFFVLGWVAERDPGLVQEIRDRGHEVASHGHEHRLVDRMGTAAFREDLRRAEVAIERACGVRPRGFRAPSFSLSRESSWAWDVLREEGYLYSSSVYPVRHDRYGIPDFPRRPVRLVGGDGRALWEVPMTTWRLLGRNLPAAGGGWLRALPRFVARRAISALNRAGDPAVVYVHPWETDPAQPRVEEASPASRFRHYLHLDQTLERLDDLLARFAFAPLAEVLHDLERRTEDGTAGTLPCDAVAARAR